MRGCVHSISPISENASDYIRHSNEGFRYLAAKKKVETEVPETKSLFAMTYRNCRKPANKKASLKKKAKAPRKTPKASRKTPKAPRKAPRETPKKAPQRRKTHFSVSLTLPSVDWKMDHQGSNEPIFRRGRGGGHTYCI